MTLTRHSMYLKAALDPKLVRARAKIALKGLQFDTVVGTGLSGVLPLHTIAEQFKVYTLAVRKHGDGSHASGLIEGSIGSRWLFVDDFISTGETFARTYRTVQAECAAKDHESVCVGAFLYTELPAYYFTPLDQLADGKRGWCTSTTIGAAINARKQEMAF